MSSELDILQREADKQRLLDNPGDARNISRLSKVSNPSIVLEWLREPPGCDFTENQQRFLVEYSKDGLTAKACGRTGVSTVSYYHWCKDPEFMALKNEVYKLANEDLEELAIGLASGRYRKPVVSAGKLVCEEQIYDTRMLALLLRGRMPERYGQKMDVTSNGQGLVKIMDKDAWDSI